MNVRTFFKIRTGRLLLCLLCSLPLAGFSQNNVSSQPDSVSRKYSHWYFGAEYGLPFLFGDFTSFSKDKTYVGYQYGGIAGYQFSSWVGFELSVRAGAAKMGAKSYAVDYLLNEAGMTYYVKQDFPTWKYNDVYTKVHFATIGGQVNLNVNNFFSANRGNRRWTVLLSPAVYLQHFSPKMYTKEGGQHIGGSGSGKWNFGAGGDLALRYKASRLFDVQLRTGISWVNNHRMDGITTQIKSKDHFMTSAGLAFIWKAGRKNTKDNVLYASKQKCEEMLPVVAELSVNIEDKAVTDSVSRENEKLALQLKGMEDKLDSMNARLQQQCTQMAEKSAYPVLGFNELPPVYFKRGEALLNVVLYRNELKRIVETLKEYPELRIRIKGYADMTGNKEINQKISLRRAEALAVYLKSQGIEAERVSVQGECVDTLTSDPNNYSILARRAIIEIQN